MELTTRHSIDTIDETLRLHGYTVTRDQHQGDEYTLRQDTGSAWVFNGRIGSKQELVDFANKL
ncbi:MAG: hypothetical protein GY869_06335 [Planctomycetes bacterium]|nr:hypothetical protein [Planctomycetota bacterium]